MSDIPTTQNCYEILEVGPQAGPEEIKKSYRKLAMKYHPDRNPGDAEAEVKFREIANAYAILSDPQKKANYDRFGTAEMPRAAGNREDFFADIFGGMSGFGQQKPGGAGKNITVPLEVTIEEVAKGANKKVTYHKSPSCRDCNGTGAKTYKPCSTCMGRGHMETKQGSFTMRAHCGHCRGQGRVTDEACESCEGRGAARPQECTLEVDVPRGIHSGMSILFQGQGDTGRNGQVGHLYAQVIVKDHPYYQRHGDDLMIETPIPYSQLVLGCSIDVPTLEGVAAMMVPAGTQPMQKLRIKGRGLPNMQDGTTGDLLVVVRLLVPTEVGPGDYLDAVKALAETEPKIIWNGECYAPVSE